MSSLTLYLIDKLKHIFYFEFDNSSLKFIYSKIEVNVMKTLEIYVSGRVQGVSYRYYTLKKAASLNITGEVKNLVDGRVMVTATGNEDDLELFLNELRQGPSYSYVTELSFNELPLKKYEKFRIVY